MVTVSDQGSDFLDKKGGVPEQDHRSLHSFFQQDLREGSYEEGAALWLETHEDYVDRASRFFHI